MSLLRLILLVLLGVILLSLGWNLVDRAEPDALPRLRVEVLNGCGTDGLAARVARELEALGQEVVRVGDADNAIYPTSLVIDRRTRPALTQRLAQRLGGLPWLSERLDDADVDVTLILGADAESLELLTSPPSVLR